VHRRKSIRLKPYDYRTAGGYFVTICTANRNKILAGIAPPPITNVNERPNFTLTLSPLGELVKAQWVAVPSYYRSVKLDEFAILPDHFHAILFLSGGDVPLGQVIGSFKSGCSRLSVNLRGSALWQRGYYDRVIRHDDDLQAYREYITTNVIRHSLTM
jgi:REP element-mobilizing transposase RayT